MSSSKYWLKREKERIDLLEYIMESHIKDLDKILIDAVKNIEKEITNLYLKYAKDNKISYQDTLKYLTDNERKEFQKDLKYYIETSKDKENLLLYRQELQALSTRARVRRLESIKASILKESNRIYDFLNKNTYNTLKNIYDESYLYNVYSLEQLGLSAKFDISSEKIIDELLSYPWSGSNYSDKVWINTDNFAKSMEQCIKVGLVQGKSINNIVKDLQVVLRGKNNNGGKLYDYKRLVRTESAFIAEQATLRSYDDFNLNQYRYLSTLDLRTSKKCQELDGKKFNVKDAKTGLNYPPMHPNCRSTTIPVTRYYEEDEGNIRIMRDPITGKNEYIDNIDYLSWKKSIYDKYVKL